MAFEVGAIIGDLELRTQKFDAGIEHGEEKAGESVGKLTGIFSELGDSISGEAGEAVSGLGELIEGLSSGPVAAVLAVVAAFAALYEVTGSVAHHIEDIGLASVKAGVSVGFMSDLAERASTVNVGVEQLSAGFRILETQAEEAAEGNKKAEESFERVGISASELAGLMENPERLFDRVKQSIGGMTDASERMAASRGLLGRGGADLIPLLAQTSAQAEHLHQIFEQTGAGVTAQDAEMGASFKELSSLIASEWEGVEKALATPVLQYIQDNLPEIEQMVTDIGTILKDVLVPGIHLIKAAADIVIPALEEVIHLAKEAMESEIVQAVVSPVSAVASVVNGIESFFKPDHIGRDGSGGSGGGGNTYNVTVTHDASESGKQFGERVIHAVRSGVDQQRDEFQAAARQRMVESNMAGEW